MSVTVPIYGFGGGGGGTGGTLTVTAPAGVTVEVSKDGKVKRKTANAEGLAVFKGLETGTWTLTITDGVQTSTKSVVITADYSTVIAFFSATINVTYPAGSTCTCSDGATTLKAPNTSGTWACIVPNAGTWTVSCTSGSKSVSRQVSITASGQSEEVSLNYHLFDRTVHEFSDFVNNAHIVDDKTLSPITDAYPYVQMASAQASGLWRVWQWKTPIDFSKYTTLEVTGYGSGKFGIDNTLLNSVGTTLTVASKQFTSSEEVLVLDVSDINITGYIGFYADAKKSIYVKSFGVI